MSIMIMLLDQLGVLSCAIYFELIIFGIVVPGNLQQLASVSQPNQADGLFECLGIGSKESIRE